MKRSSRQNARPSFRHWSTRKTPPRWTSGEFTIATPRSAHLKASATASHDPSGQLLGHALVVCEAAAAAPAQERAERPAGSAPEGLTPQEQKVLQLVGEGLSNRQIAEKMQVAPSTVRSHLKHLYNKLGLRSRSEAVAYALRNPAAAS